MCSSKWLIFLFCLVTLVLSPNCCAAIEQRPVAYLLSLKGAVVPAMSDYINRGIAKAGKQGASVIVLLIDTPGGLDKSMRSIISNILLSSVPIIAYVAPSGARAASAGTFILYACHIAAMAPGTNLGAATPVSIGGDSSSSKEERAKTPEEVKTLNDASAYIRSLAQLRHRNITWAEQAVTKGVSLSANEALALNVIDLIAVDLDELFKKVNGKKILIKNRQVELNTANILVKQLSPDWRTQFLDVITDPNVAYILLLVGIYGLLFEFLNPGFVLPGVAGLISLLIALYAFQLLPINYVGLALILVGIAFIVAEAFIPSFGALGIGGIIAFMIGSVMLVDRQVPGYTLLLSVIIAVSLVTVAVLLFMVQLAIRSHKKPIVSGREELIGSEGKVFFVDGDKQRPRIRIRGEIWQVQSSSQLEEGKKVKVIGIEDLVLVVTPVH